MAFKSENKKMKIGILSFHYVRNYGAVLQNFALQTFLSESFSNFQVETIDYRCKYLISNYNKRILTNSKASILDYSIKDCGKFLINIPHYFRREKNFKKFINKNIKLSRKVKSKKTLGSFFQSYDAIVSGSDQVFNVSITKDDFSYFIDSSQYHGYRLSYAASMCWNSCHESLKPFFIPKLLKFDAISLRESVDALHLENNNINSSINVDPTLLLSRDQWIKIEEKCGCPKKYILFFELINSPQAADLAREKAKEENVPLLFLSSDDKPWKYKDMIHMENISPQQFIFLVHNCSMVYTNSFHGLMFSLLFQKPFYCQSSFNDKRMIDSLDSIGLKGAYKRDDYGVSILDSSTYDSFQLVDHLEEKKHSAISFFLTAFSREAKNAKSSI
jgi:hypothetical protein